jgi:hypothetical protein
MTREEFIIDAVKNPGKIYYNSADNFYYKTTLVNNNLRFLTCTSIEHNNWEKVRIFFEGNYQPLETPEQSFVEKYLSIAVEYYSEEEKQRIFKMRAELIQSYVDEQIEKLRREFLGGK